MAEPVLRDLFLFQDVPEALDQLALPPAETYAKGDVIYGGRTFRRALGVVLEGRAVAASGDGVALNSFGPGAVFGAAALFGGGGEYASCVTAATRCRVQFIPEETLETLFRQHPQTALRYIAFLSSRVRFLNGKIATFTAPSAAARLYTWCRANCDDAGRLPSVSMTALARMLDMGRTSLYRALDELTRRGLIQKDKGEWMVL